MKNLKVVTKQVQIEFASPKIQAVDSIYDIRKAAKYASLNLYSRHDIQLQMPMIINGRVVIELKIPEDMVKGKQFSFGKRLKGISSYLLKECDGRYNQYLIGDRLLIYIDVTEKNLVQDTQVKGIELADRFEAIANFAKLMERTDDEAIDQTNRIIDILNEGR